MNLTYYKIHKTSHLVKEFYHIFYPEKTLNSTIIPMGIAGLVYVESDGLKVSFNNKNTLIKGLVFNGQFNQSYKFDTSKNSAVCGVSFKPSAFYKLTGLDISSFTNKYVNINHLHPDLSSKFENLFKKHNNNFNKLFKEIENLILDLPLIENKNTKAIDALIDYMHLKEGMIAVNELLDKVPFSQKTLETQFKKMVGLTPSKYIRIHRFKNLMVKYESKEINLKDLIYMYDYYDESHFAKDFKLFTSKSMKDYFKDEFTLIKKVLKKHNYEFLQ